MTTPKQLTEEAKDFNNLMAFLHGSEMRNGRWFGDKPSNTEGVWWWRSEMDDVIEAYITSHSQLAVEGVLDRLEKESYGMYNDYRDVVDIVPLSAIQAERNHNKGSE